MKPRQDRERVRTRPAIFFLAFLALAIQCLVVQPHIHAAATASLTQTALDSGSAPLGKGDPATDSNCPLCSQLLGGGHFLAPSVISFALPQSASLAAHQAASAQTTSAPSHIWQGRAPPRI